MDRARFNYPHVVPAMFGVLLKETLSGNDLERLFGRGTVPPAPVVEKPYAGTAGSA